MSLRQPNEPLDEIPLYRHRVRSRRFVLTNLWAWFIVGLLGAVGGFVAALNDDPAMWIVTPIALIAMVRCGREF